MHRNVITSGFHLESVTLQALLTLFAQYSDFRRSLTAIAILLHAEILHEFNDTVVDEASDHHRRMRDLPCVVTQADREAHHAVLRRIRLQLLEKLLPLIETDDYHDLDFHLLRDLPAEQRAAFHQAASPRIVPLRSAGAA